MVETVKEKTELELCKGFVEYIIQKTGVLSKSHMDATLLNREIKACIKKDKKLSSFWRLVAQRLFNDYKISDDRISFDDILTRVKFEHEGKEYSTEVRYVDFDIDKFPEGILILNQEREDEELHIVKSIKRSMERYKNCDTEKVYVFQNYVLVLANNGAQKVS